MGYEVNSPIKQVWLPLDQAWLHNQVADRPTFAVFAKEYKEKYGIDLHDIFELHKSETEYFVISKVDLLGAYNVPPSDITYHLNQSRFALPNAIRAINSGTQSASVFTNIMAIAIVDPSETFYVGFYIVLPKNNVVINSIDDLLMGIYEI